MPVPKRKRSRARRDSRFANKGLVVKSFTACQNCQLPLMTHQACLHCGFYKGVKVLKTKLDRTVKRAQERQKKSPQEQRTAEQAEQQ
jgi:large subunit ribosomal protein L32